MCVECLALTVEARSFIDNHMQWLSEQPDFKELNCPPQLGAAGALLFTDLLEACGDEKMPLVAVALIKAAYQSGIRTEREKQMAVTVG